MNRRSSGKCVFCLMLLTSSIPTLMFAAEPFQGQQNMFSSFSAQPLLWQNAVARKPVRFVPVVVSSVAPYKGGWLGVGNSPSLVGAFPDARDVEGKALDGSGHVVAVRAPGAELPHGLAPGQRVVLGLVDDAHVICFLVPPSDVPIHDLIQWAAGQRCG